MVIDQGYNVADNADCGLIPRLGDVVQAPDSGAGGIGLGPLVDNGGLTPTAAIGATSAASHRVPLAACPPVDQRGEPRAQPDSAGTCDAGSYEAFLGAPASITLYVEAASAGAVDTGSCMSDSMPCASLEYAVDQAEKYIDSRITIEVSGGSYSQPVTIAAGTTDTLDIVGDGATVLGSPSGSPAFTVERGSVTISGLSIDARGGQGIRAVGGTVNITGDTITDASAQAGGAVEIGVSATAVITDDTFEHDSASDGGGAIANQGTATVSFDTFSGDAAPAGSALANLSGTTTILGDVFADGGSAGSNCSVTAGTVTDGGHNVADDTSCGLSSGNGDVVGAPDSGAGGIDLGELAHNGGPPTEAPGPSSVALHLVPPASCPHLDERGMTRVQPGTVDTCDAGAYESTPAPLTTTSTTS
jgi:hypothetical protein